MATERLSELETAAVEHLRALIRFDTSNPPGDERPAAEYVAAVGRLRGRGEGPPLLMLGHLDTVPAEPERWTHPPWAAELADGCVWGRGAIASKLTVATQLAALVDLAKSGWAPG